MYIPVSALCLAWIQRPAGASLYLADNSDSWINLLATNTLGWFVFDIVCCLYFNILWICLTPPFLRARLEVILKTQILID